MIIDHLVSASALDAHADMTLTAVICALLIFSLAWGLMYGLRLGRPFSFLRTFLDHLN